MLTYWDIKNIYHTEKKTSSLSKLNDNFYSEARELLAQVEDAHREHLSKLLSEIYEKRKEKLMINAASGNKPDNLIPDENELYHEILIKLENFRNKVLSGKGKAGTRESEEEKDETLGVLEPAGEKPKATNEAPDHEKIRLRIIQNMPAIIGSDLVHYELKENDEVEMPKTDAKILIKNRIAIRI